MQNMPVVFVVAPLAAATDDTATSFLTMRRGYLAIETNIARIPRFSYTYVLEVGPLFTRRHTTSLEETKKGRMLW